MIVFVKRLAVKVVGVFVVSMFAVMAASRPFSVLEFDWMVAFTVSASAAVLALVEGLAGRFTGDPERPRLSE